MNTPKAPALFDLFGKAVPPEFFDQLRERLSLSNRGIYSLGVVVWLMMWQRLDGRGSDGRQSEFPVNDNYSGNTGSSCMSLGRIKVAKHALKWGFAANPRI